MATAQEEIFDVLIIGGGWSGLMACKYAKEEKLSVVVLEKREDIGGVWNFCSNPEITTVMKNTCTSSSSTVTEFSDYPMPNEIGEFPKHFNILKYLKSYAEEHNLYQNVKFGTSVESMVKEGNVWTVISDSNIEYRAFNIIVCSGVHQNPNRVPEKTILKGFKGEIMHSGELKEFDKKHTGKRVMVLGGGETASDILDEYYAESSKIVWCIPRGQHFFRKRAKLLPHREPQALDKASSRALKFISPHVKSKPGLAWVCKWTTNGSVLAYQGHGIPEFRNEAPFFHQFINKHAHALDYIDYKKVIPKGEIDHIRDQTVYFKDGSFEEVDLIIQCTGFTVSFPFLPSAYRNLTLTDLYKYVYLVEDPSLSFVGYVRPIVGSIPGIGEMQARWICRVLSGRVKLADHFSRVQAVKDDFLFWQDYFKDTSRRISTLVEGYTYLDQLAILSNCYPDYWSLFQKDPKAFFAAYFAPYNGCSYLLNEENKREKALETLKKHSKGTLTALNCITIILMRLFLFDWFCDILGTLKYKLQISKRCQYIQKWRVVRFLNYLWCTPKRYLFDNKTR